MLFTKNMEPRCSYCRYGTELGRNETACRKRGIMQSGGYCGSFRYEPTKRVPPVLPYLNSANLTDEDFTV